MKPTNENEKLIEAIEYLVRCINQVPEDVWHSLVKYDGEYCEISPLDQAKDAINEALKDGAE